MEFFCESTKNQQLFLCVKSLNQNDPPAKTKNKNTKNEDPEGFIVCPRTVLQILITDSLLLI